MAKKEFAHPLVDPMNGNEKFMVGSDSSGFDMREFWSYMYSNILDNIGDLGEFIVAKALNVKFNKKYGWTLYDIDYCGKRIEVKSTAYFQPWRADGKVSQQRIFSIRKSHSVEGDMSSPLERNSDAYVFALNTGTNADTAYPLQLEHWRFWVIKTDIISEKCGEHKTISLKKIIELSEDEKGLTFDQLKGAVNNVIKE